MDIPGLDLLRQIYGYTPTFHDAYLLGSSTEIAGLTLRICYNDLSQVEIPPQLKTFTRTEHGDVYTLFDITFHGLISASVNISVDLYKGQFGLVDDSFRFSAVDSGHGEESLVIAKSISIELIDEREWPEDKSGAWDFSLKISRYPGFEK